MKNHLFPQNDHWWCRQESSISELMKTSWHIILPTLTFISCPPADCSKITIILSMSAALCARVFVCVYAYCLCMREQPRRFIKMSPVMAAKLTMCFGEKSWLDKSLCGRRCVWSTPIHLYGDLSQVRNPLLTGFPIQHLHRKDVLTDGQLINCTDPESQRENRSSWFSSRSKTN